MTNEIQLLLYCASTQINTQRTEQISQLLQQELNWQYLLNTAQEHGVTPLVYSQLKSTDSELVPPEVRQKLSSTFNTNACHNLALTSELCKIQELFSTQNIPFLSFKGSVLAQLAYQNIALRQFVDIDILISESDVKAVSELLINNGYQPQFSFTQKQQEKYLTIRSEHNFFHPHKEITIDLHWSLLPKHFSFSPEQKLVWSQLQTVNFGKTTVKTMSPEITLLFLCAHAAKHNWNHLCWICDLAEIINNNPELDWNFIKTHQGYLGTEKMVNLSLYLAHDLLNAQLPQSVWQQIELDSNLPVLAQEVKAILFENKSYYVGSFPVANIYLKTMTSWQDKVWYWLDAITTPTPLEWSILPLPMWLFTLYYPIRLIRLIFKSSFNIKH